MIYGKPHLWTYVSTYVHEGLVETETALNYRLLEPGRHSEISGEILWQCEKLFIFKRTFDYCFWDMWWLRISWIALLILWSHCKQIWWIFTPLREFLNMSAEKFINLSQQFDKGCHKYCNQFCMIMRYSIYICTYIYISSHCFISELSYK